MFYVPICITETIQVLKGFNDGATAAAATTIESNGFVSHSFLFGKSIQAIVYPLSSRMHIHTHSARFEFNASNSFSFIKNEQNSGYSGSSSKVFIITEWVCCANALSVEFYHLVGKSGTLCSKWWNLSANSILNGSQYHFYGVSEHNPKHIACAYIEG